MVHYTRVLQGLTDYVDRELISQMGGSLKGWIAGALVGIVMERGREIMAELVKNPMVKALGLADGENIDVDALYRALIEQARKGSATVNIPLLGPVTFKESDVEALYRMIIG